MIEAGDDSTGEIGKRGGCAATISVVVGVAGVVVVVVVVGVVGTSGWRWAALTGAQYRIGSGI